MKNSNVVQQEYLNLRNKVQDQIKLLQQKLTKNSTIRYHRSLSNKMNNLNIQAPISSFDKQYHHHCCHSHHQCRHGHHNNEHSHANCSSHSCSKNNSFRYQQNSKDPILQNANSLHIQASRAQQNKQIAQSNIQTRLLEEALVKSLQNQKELAQNLKLLNQKIEKLSEQKSSRISEFENNRLNISDININCLTSKSSSNIRIKSQIQEQQNPVLRQYSRYNNLIPQNSNCRDQSKRNKLKRPQKRSKNHDAQYLYQVRSQKRLKTPSLLALRSKKQISISKKSQNLGHQYFGGQKICPIHSHPHVGAVTSPQKQIYKDSQHRNRKHQRDHLLQSFRQQQIARKKLMAKITHNGFHNYGAK